MWELVPDSSTRAPLSNLFSPSEALLKFWNRHSLKHTGIAIELHPIVMPTYSVPRNSGKHIYSVLTTYSSKKHRIQHLEVQTDP